jgi:hypothetical protein
MRTARDVFVNDDEERRSQVSLVACSLCLSVRNGSSWVPPESVIRELRSYELAHAPRLDSAICDDCTQAISSRRAGVGVTAAA